MVIINDILDFSKNESGKLNIVKVDYEPLSMVNDLVNVINTRVGFKKLELTVDFAPEIPRKLYGDNVRIHQILLNLLNNAVKFTEHGEVHLSVSCEAIDRETVMLKAVIRDTGIGIKKEDMDKLFQSFQQVDSKRNRNIEGTGLGLAISRRLLTLMNGSISVKSEYEKGSSFYIELPQKVIDSAPSVPFVEGNRKAALLVRNRYVSDQLCTDLSALHIDHFTLDDVENAGGLQADWLIVESGLFDDRVKDFVRREGSIRCLVIVPFDEPFETDLPEIRVLRKPVYTLGLYLALNPGTEISLEEHTEKDNFVFTAPDVHVLVVDDNPINLTVASGIIKPLGMQVDTAGGASETIDKVKKLKYDIIFMDHMMPEVDGVETTHIIRRLVPGYENIPIIALTANAMGGTKEMFLREGMNDFVAKPIEVSEMVAMVRKWLPPEKIIPVEKKTIPQETPETSEVLSVEGLNTKQALALLGSEKLYLQILRDYYLSIDKRAAIISEAFEKGDLKVYTIEVHSLKSTSRQIGADDLWELAARLEKAGNDRDAKYISQKNGELISLYRRYKEIIAPLFPDISSEPDVVQVNDEVCGLLREASAEIKSDDLNALKGTVEKMSALRLSPAQAQCLEKLKCTADSGSKDIISTILSIWIQIASAESGKKMSSASEVQDSLEEMEQLSRLVVPDGALH